MIGHYVSERAFHSRSVLKYSRTAQFSFSPSQLRSSSRGRSDGFGLPERVEFVSLHLCLVDPHHVTCTEI